MKKRNYNNFFRNVMRWVPIYVPRQIKSTQGNQSNGTLLNIFFANLLAYSIRNFQFCKIGKYGFCRMLPLFVTVNSEIFIQTLCIFVKTFPEEDLYKSYLQHPISKSK